MASDQQPAEHTPPEVSRGEIRDQWDSVAAGWEKWEPYFASSSWPVTLRLLLELKLQPGMHVLDVGCGIGDPALAIGSVVGPAGKVLAIDLAASMLKAAGARADKLGLTNIEFRALAVEDLPASSGMFGAISSRFAIMFFTDLAAGLGRLHDLVRPGGRIAVSTWAAMDRNPMFRIPSEQLAKVAHLPKTSRDAPGPMRLSRDGELQAALEQAGLVDVGVHDVPMYNFARTAEEYFQLVFETTSMFRRAFDSLSDRHQRQVREGLMAEVSKYADRGVIRVPALARVGTGARPTVEG